MPVLIGATVVIAGLIVGGVQMHFLSNRAAEMETKLSISIYDLHANKRNIKALTEREAPLP